MKNKEMLKAIDHFLNEPPETEEDDVELDLEKFRNKESINDLVIVLTDMGCNVKMDEIESNGWQYDICVPFYYDGYLHYIEFGAFYNKLKLTRQ